MIQVAEISKTENCSKKIIQVADISKTQNCTTKEVMSGELAQLCWIYSASFAQDLLHICNSARNDKQEHQGPM